MKQQRLRLILIEDNIDDLFFLRRALEKAGLAVDLQHVTNRAEFEAALSGQKVDVIISDSRSEDLEGASAFEIAKGRFPGIPFYFFTGFGDHGHPPPWLPEGASHISKEDPAAMVQLAARLAHD